MRNFSVWAKSVADSTPGQKLYFEKPLDRPPPNFFHEMLPQRFARSVVTVVRMSTKSILRKGLECPNYAIERYPVDCFEAAARREVSGCKKCLNHACKQFLNQVSKSWSLNAKNVWTMHANSFWTKYQNHDLAWERTPLGYTEAWRKFRRFPMGPHNTKPISP